MRNMRSWIFPLLSLGCAIPGFERDPRAVLPRYDRWEAVVGSPADSAYTAALAVVLESGYTVALASRTDRVITTHLRQVQAGSALSAQSYDLRFTISVRAVGADSARLAVTGDTCFGDDLSECAAVTAYQGGAVGRWQFVRRLGEATLARLAASRLTLFPRPPRSGVAVPAVPGPA